MRVIFKEETAVEKRREAAKRIFAAHPERIPVIVQKDVTNELAPDISKTKFLAPAEITMGRFFQEVRKHMYRASDASSSSSSSARSKGGEVDTHSISFFFEDQRVPNPSLTMAQIYRQHRDEDGFLYLFFTTHQMFG